MGALDFARRRRPAGFNRYIKKIVKAARRLKQYQHQKRKPVFLRRQTFHDRSLPGLAAKEKWTRMRLSPASPRAKRKEPSSPFVNAFACDKTKARDDKTMLRKSHSPKRFWRAANDLSRPFYLPRPEPIFGLTKKRRKPMPQAIALVTALGVILIALAPLAYTLTVLQ
jgi:hypothetical protein